MNKAIVIQWLDELTDGQTRAIAHQIGIAGAVTHPIDKLRESMKSRRHVQAAKKIYEEHYAQ